MKIAVKGVIPVLCLFMAMPLLRAQNNNSSTVRTGVVGSTNNTSSSSISVRAKSLYEKEAISRRYSLDAGYLPFFRSEGGGKYAFVLS